MNYVCEIASARASVAHDSLVSFERESARLATAFRHAMRGVASTVTIVSTCDALGRNHGMAATAFSAVSMDPPTALVCINSNASIHEHLLGGRVFCINVLNVASQELVASFSGSAKGEDRFRFGHWEAHLELQAPYLLDAQSNVLCRIASIAKVGTHSVVVGEVIAVRSGGDFAPLVYADGRYGMVSGLS